MSKPLLGGWSIRGLDQPVHLAYALAGVDYEDIVWEHEHALDMDKEKSYTGLVESNLSYLFNGDFKLVESNAILHHVARTHDLYGQSEEHKCRVDMMLCMLSNARVPYATLCHQSDSKSWQANKANFLNNQLLDVLSKFTAFLGSRAFVAGDVVTVADAALFEFLDAMIIFDKEQGQGNLIDAYPKLKELHARVAALEPVAKYMASIKRPMNAFFK